MKLASILLIIFSSLTPNVLLGSDTEQMMIDKNRWLSRVFDRWAEDLDLYLADRRYSGEMNKTKVVIHSPVRWRQNQNIQFSPNVSARLHLPNTQKKWQLAFTTADDDDDDQGINRHRPNVNTKRESFSTILAVAETFGSVKTKFEPRFQYSDRFETKFRLEISTDADLGWIRFEPELQLFANDSSGTGQFLSLGLILTPSDAHNIQLVNEQQYTDKDNTVSTNHGPIWTIIHSDTVATRYSFIAEANNRPRYNVERYTAMFSFMHKYYRNVLHYSISPLVYWEREHEFKTLLGLDFTFEIIF